MRQYSILYIIFIFKGLIKQWKQPIFYSFDTALTQDILFNVITNMVGIRLGSWCS